MRKPKLCILLLCAAILSGMCACSGDVRKFEHIDRTDMMRAEEYTYPKTIPYRIFAPENYDPARPLPLVLYLHGRGECGDDNHTQTEVNSVMQTLFTGENLAKYPCIVLAPQCPEDGWWEPAPLMGLLEHTKAAYSVDDNRVYVTGLSMGGYGTWSLLAAYPAYFAAAVPICGGGDPEAAPLFKDVPIWVFHGARDDHVSVKESRDMVKALKDAGSTKVKYTEYPRVYHDSWERAYREPELFEWMFGQVRGE